MIIVTGGAGFIGSNIVKKLNSSGRDDILVVDNLSNGAKFRNLVDCRIADYMDKEDFLALLKCADGFPGSIDVVFHMGACSTTTEWDGRYMMRNNYEYSKELMHYCVDRHIQFIYASSAAVYGGGTDFREDPEVEHPLNIYGYSKLLFDQYVRRHLSEATSQIVGFRYFNVYGPREQHKESMASVAFHFSNQLKQSGMLKLFEGTDGYAAGEQRRDFVYVDDVADVNLWFMQNSDVSGIFNLGTGRSQTFNDVARAAIAWHGEGKIEYVPFPGHLIGCYQSFTQADLTALRSAGYNGEFLTVEQGVKHYLDTLHAEPVVGP